MADNSKGKDEAQEQVPWVSDEQMKRDHAHREASRILKMITVSPQVYVSKPVRPLQAYLELMALHHSRHTTPSAVRPDATDDEKAADRERRLAAPTTKHRKVFFEWPRDPNGDILRPEHSNLGKVLANKVQFWGATLLDFYHTMPIPHRHDLVITASGSILAEWMKAQGETYAEGQLTRAEREPDPKEVIPYPMGGLLKSLSGGFGAFQPFVKTSFLPVLQQRILLSFLPKTLIVHDPYRTLTARRSSVRPTSWDQEPDIIHTYRLQLSEAGKKKMLIEAQFIELADAATEARSSDFLENPTAECRPHERGFLFVPQGTKPGPCPPAVFFMHGARPPKTTTEEAHLYLTPNQLCGTGNHSVVYNAEWEVPRSLIVEDVICKKCVFEKGIEILVAEDGPNGDTKDPKWLQETGTVVETAHEDPGLTIANKDAIEDENGECVSYDIEPPSLKVSRKYNGPVRVIDTGVQWQRAADGNTCKHRTGEPGQPLSPSEPPLTARVSIVAKMSLGYDYHLKTEANVYQKFPDHFYQHFTGYNIIAPLQDPVPVWALVPQFYGYYLPDKTIPPSFWKKGNRDGKGQNKGADDGEEKDGTSEKADRLKYDYRSPLMLIEHCGETVCNILDSMSIDDRQHCASLFLRLHHEGWLHNSLYTRNILYQPGPVDASPMERAQKATKRSDLRKTSFRLIDFGRTEKIQDRSLRLWEEDVATKTFKVLHDAMD